MPDCKIDLHTHTNHSDGALTPTQLVQKAHSIGLQLISITDHDSINGLEEAISCGYDLGVEVIPGVEISTDIDNKEMHILGYFFDIHNEELHKYLKFFRDERFHRAKRIVHKLRNFGLEITIDDIVELAKNSAIGRPHIASTLVKLGLVGNYYEAFEKYLRDNGPAYERKIHVSPQSALKLLNDAGGLSFIAHPGNVDESILMHFIKAGIDGIEVVHPSHNQFQVKFYRGIVNQYCLLESGGSDYHGGVKGDDQNLGKYCVQHSTVDAMRQMLLKNNLN